MAAARTGDGAMSTPAETSSRLRLKRIVSIPATAGSPVAFAISARPGSFLLAGDEAGAVAAPAIVALGPWGELRGDVRLPRASRARAIAFDEHHGRLLLADRAGALWAIPADARGGLDPARAARLSPPGAIASAAMIAIGAEHGEIVALDPTTRRLVRWMPGSPRAETSDLPAWAVEARGLAIDPTSGHAFVIDARGRRLYELTRAGALLAILDLETLGFQAPRALAFAPSTDATDDPAVQSLFVLDAKGTSETRIVELASTSPAVVQAPTTLTATLVRTVRTSEFSPPSPDPSGIGYDASIGRLVISDGEVDEMTIWAGSNVFETSLSGTLHRSYGVLAYSREPTGVAYDSKRRWRYLTDDDAKRVFVVRPGADGVGGTADDVVSWFSTTAFGSSDPEGISHDPVTDRLFIADGVNEEVYVLTTGANGVFDGVSPGGDDQLTQFDTNALGVTDPETVEFRPGVGTLFLIGRTQKVVLEVTTSGTPVSQTDLSFAPLANPAGLAYAPSSSNPSGWSWYIVNRAVDNDSNPNENDGVMLELALGAPPPPPSSGLDYRVASSADDAEESATGSVSLTSTDLELVFDGSLQKVGMRFAGVAIPRGAAIASAFLQLAADEVQTEATSLTLQGQASDNAPSFATASGNVSTRPRTSAAVTWSPAAWSVAGAVGPDQRSPDLAAVIQEIVNRPGWSSGNALAIIVTGTGHRTADAYDDNPSTAPLLHVELRPPNLPPVVNAGSDQTITLPAGAMLDGTVSDDGLPNPPGAVTVAWSVVSGPGAVSFANPNAIDTQASFAASGAYVLRLAANDGALASSDQVAITVMPSAPSNQAPVVNAGPDQTITLPAAALLDGTVSDDGLPNPPAAVTVAWSVVSGPGAVTFANPNAIDTQASFAASGAYVLRLTANDGALANSDQVAITVVPSAPSNQAPVVNAGSDQTIVLPASATLDGTVSDDGLPNPPGAMTVAWSVVSGPGAVSFVDPNAIDTQASFAASGAYVLRLTANDGTLATSDQVAITVQSGITTLERRISAGGDDAEESVLGVVSLASLDLQLVDEVTRQVVGLRFRNVGIPRNATILRAYVQFRAAQADSGPVSLVVQAHASDNAPAFGVNVASLSSRPRTSATAVWSPPAWNAGETTPAQRTTELAAVIQEIVSRPGWASGNALAIVITGEGRRTAQSYEARRPSAAVLHVEYRP